MVWWLPSRLRFATRVKPRRSCYYYYFFVLVFKLFFFKFSSQRETVCTILSLNSSLFRGLVWVFASPLVIHRFLTSCGSHAQSVLSSLVLLFHLCVCPSVSVFLNTHLRDASEFYVHLSRLDKNRSSVKMEILEMWLLQYLGMHCGSKRSTWANTSNMAAFAFRTICLWWTLRWNPCRFAINTLWLLGKANITKL